MTARGIRLNNPGNLDRTTVAWQGMADDQSADPRFVVFKTPQYGIRALAKTLLTYQNHDGCKTIRQIISRWAPPSENNTDAYIFAVAAGCGVSADAAVSVDQTAVMLPLVKAIILHENGSDPYPDSVLLEGLRMAGVSDAPAKPLLRQNSVLTNAGSAVAVAAAGTLQAASHVATFAPSVKQAADSLSDYSGSPLIAHAITIMITVAGGLAMVGLAADFLKHRSEA